MGSTTSYTHEVSMIHGPPVSPPNGNIIRAFHTTLPNFLQLSLDACQAHILPSLRNKKLLSIGQLCNNRLSVVFDQHHVTAFNANQLSLSDNRDLNNGLYYITFPTTLYPPVTRTVSPSIPFRASTHIEDHSAYKITMQANLVQFLHRSAFSPVNFNWTQTIDAGYFTTWPGLTSALVRK